MSGFHLAVVPVGRIDVAELEVAAVRAARVLHQPLELREPLGLPPGTEDAVRGQHRAGSLVEKLAADVLKLKPGRLVGGDDAAARPPLKPDAFLFVTDVDLFTAKTEGVLAAIVPRVKSGVISVRRQREAFYRRRADPGRQRLRLVKELLRLAARLKGLPECTELACALAPSRSVHDVDAKQERFCRACETRLLHGRLAI